MSVPVLSQVGPTSRCSRTGGLPSRYQSRDGTGMERASQRKSIWPDRPLPLLLAGKGWETGEKVKKRGNANTVVVAVERDCGAGAYLSRCGKYSGGNWTGLGSTCVAKEWWGRQRKRDGT